MQEKTGKWNVGYFKFLSISFDLDESLSVIFKLSACVKISKKVNVQKISDSV